MGRWIGWMKEDRKIWRKVGRVLDGSARCLVRRRSSACIPPRACQSRRHPVACMLPTATACRPPAARCPLPAARCPPRSPITIHLLLRRRLKFARRCCLSFAVVRRVRHDHRNHRRCCRYHIVRRCRIAVGLLLSLVCSPLEKSVVCWVWPSFLKTSGSCCGDACTVRFRLGFFAMKAQVLTPTWMGGSTPDTRGW